MMKLSFALCIILSLSVYSSLAQSVSYISFTARWDTIRGNVLTWSTSQEINNAYFEVQRSAFDLATFQTIGRVTGKGTSSVRQDYEYVDMEGTLTDFVYYRLKQFDLAGNIRYTAAQALLQGPIGVPSLTILNVYPGPGTDFLQLKLTNRHFPSSVRVFDNRGILLSSKEVVRNDLVDVRLLPGGFYVLEVITTSGQIVRKRFFK